MSLPAIDFATIASTAKAALASYGTQVSFREHGSSSSRNVRAVIYRDGTSMQQFVADADTSLATAILNPDDFQQPNRMPQKFDTLTVNLAGITRIYTIDSVAPILAQDTMPLIMVQLRSN